MRRIAALLAFSGTACTSMQVQRAPTSAVVNDRQGRDIRVTLASGERVNLFDATLRGDSIVGYTAKKTDMRTQLRAVATADVTEVAVQKFSPIRTVFAVGAVVAAVAILASGSSSSQPSNSSTSCASGTVAPAAS